MIFFFSVFFTSIIINIISNYGNHPYAKSANTSVDIWNNLNKVGRFSFRFFYTQEF